MNSADLLDEGIRAYTRGDFAAAERCWTEVLALEPGHARARSYLDLLGARAARQAAPEWRPARPGTAGRTAAAPPPAAGADGAARDGRLPATSGPGAAPGPSWLQPPAGAVDRPPDLPPAVAGDATRPGPEGASSPWDQGPSAAPAVLIGEGDGLDLSSVAEKSEVRALVPDAEPSPPAAPARPRTEVEIWMEGARELSALGDFSGSLEMIEKILRVDPGHVEARRHLEQNEATLIAMYESKLGPRHSVPRLAIKPEEVMWLNLDHRAGFLLAQIDGTVTYEDLFALSGLPRLDTARILAALLNEGVIQS